MTDIIAHRGASRECLENTLEAFARALAHGADGIELDVHASQDGIILVHHDPVIRGTTADGRTVELEIADSPSQALLELRLTNLEAPPTLDAVFDLVGLDANVFVEVKGLGIEAQVAACLGRHGNARVAVHSFDHRIPIEVRRIYPGLRTGVLSASYLLDLACMLEPSQADDLWQHAALIDRLLVDQGHAMGVQIIAWTENNTDRARQLVELGVDAICTDTPRAIREGLTAQLHG